MWYRFGILIDRSFNIVQRISIAITIWPLCDNFENSKRGLFVTFYPFDRLTYAIHIRNPHTLNRQFQTKFRFSEIQNGRHTTICMNKICYLMTYIGLKPLTNGHQYINTWPYTRWLNAFPPILDTDHMACGHLGKICIITKKSSPLKPSDRLRRVIQIWNPCGQAFQYCSKNFDRYYKMAAMWRFRKFA